MEQHSTPRRPENSWTACSVCVLDSAASSELQIAPGGVRGRRGPNRLLLLPHTPGATLGTLLCACSERSTRASRQEAVWWGATLREGDAAFSLSGKLFLSGAGLLTGVLGVGCSLLGLQLGTYQGVISRGKWDRHAAVPEKGAALGPISVSAPRTEAMCRSLFKHRGQSSEQRAPWIHPSNLWCK